MFPSRGGKVCFNLELYMGSFCPVKVEAAGNHSQLPAKRQHEAADDETQEEFHDFDLHERSSRFSQKGQHAMAVLNDEIRHQDAQRDGPLGVQRHEDDMGAGFRDDADKACRQQNGPFAPSGKRLQVDESGCKVQEEDGSERPQQNSRRVVFQNMDAQVFEDKMIVGNGDDPRSESGDYGQTPAQPGTFVHFHDARAEQQDRKAEERGYGEAIHAPGPARGVNVAGMGHFVLVARHIERVAGTFGFEMQQPHHPVSGDSGNNAKSQQAAKNPPGPPRQQCKQDKSFVATGGYHSGDDAAERNETVRVHGADGERAQAPRGGPDGCRKQVFPESANAKNSVQMPPRPLVERFDENHHLDHEDGH